MADKGNRQRLKHGKALCERVFPGFVDTWNWLVDFCRNLAGDAENGGVGTVKVDRTDPARPVIRVEHPQKIGGSGGGSAETTGLSGDYNIVTGVSWDSDNHRIVMTGKTLTFENGLLTAVADISTESASVPDGFAPIVADPHSGEHSTS